MNKRDVPDWEKLEWNCGDDWAIPLPEFPIDSVLVFRRWYVPKETPVIPTGWIYELAREEVVSEYSLWCRLTVEPQEPDVDDSLPQWTDYYSNESDYWIAEYPEVIN